MALSKVVRYDRRMKIGSAWLCGLVVCACGPTTDVAGTETEGNESGPATSDASGPPIDTVDGGSDESSDTQGPSAGSVALTINRDIDLLIVIDNSSSMSEEQGRLASNLATLTAAFDAANVNYRIGVTTTDNSNPWCTGTTPEGGALRFSSCRSRAPDFVSAGGGDSIQESCFDACVDAPFDVTPTPTAVDPTPSPRPWLQVTTGVANVTGVTAAEAIQCALPQGINGCGFEQPLESLWKALRRSEDESDPGYGFLRRNAVLGVLVVTDEADCSYHTDHESIFLPEGDRFFWSDPSAPTPSSAVCWNAGVACDGSDCNSVNLDPTGVETAADDAVMRPVSRYVELLQELEDLKQQITPNQEVVFAMLGGVAADGSVTYQDSLDPEYQDSFGIGPGCVSAAGEAVPPVRLREVSDALAVGGAQSRFSICEPDYAAEVGALADQLLGQIRPACMPLCVADTDPTTEALDPSCIVGLEFPEPDGTVTEVAVAQCNGEPEDVCWTPLTGSAMSSVCSDEGWNLEFEFSYAPGYALPEASAVRATCELSQSESVDCPQL